MKRTDFHFELPPALIASHPAESRTGSRLLVLDRQQQEFEDRLFRNILDYVQPGDLLVFNDTRVIPARLFGQKATGGQIEILVERLLDTQRCVAHIRASKSPKPGSVLHIDNTALNVIHKHDALYELELPAQQGTLLELLESKGHMPLPPYIEREDDFADRERYQTVYGRHPGAVAAPTAGLHFDEALLQQIRATGIETAFTTLHVGAGTFQPVRADNIIDHQMHKEWLRVTPAVVEQVKAVKAAGGRVFAVGTTSVRSLETAASSGELQPFEGDTDIFIYPGYQFRVVDALLTNFHLPESTLIMLVSAFAGREYTLQAYQHAVQQQYRFFSYGDAMLIV